MVDERVQIGALQRDDPISNPYYCYVAILMILVRIIILDRPPGGTAHALEQ